MLDLWLIVKQPNLLESLIHDKLHCYFQCPSLGITPPTTCPRHDNVQARLRIRSSVRLANFSASFLLAGSTKSIRMTCIRMTLADKKKRRNLPPILKLVSHLNKILNQADCPSFQDRGTKVFWTMLWSIFLYSFPLQWKKLLMALNWTSAYNDLVFMGR